MLCPAPTRTALMASPRAPARRLRSSRPSDLVLKNYKIRESRQRPRNSWQIAFWIPRSVAASVSEVEHMDKLRIQGCRDPPKATSGDGRCAKMAATHRAICSSSISTAISTEFGRVAAWKPKLIVISRFHGLPAQQRGRHRAVRIFKTYGADAVQDMTENPYRLARDIRGIGFKTADAIAMKLGVEKTAMIRLRAGISYALTEAMTKGIAGCRLMN